MGHRISLLIDFISIRGCPSARHKYFMPCNHFTSYAIVCQIKEPASTDRLEISFFSKMQHFLQILFAAHHNHRFVSAELVAGVGDRGHLLAPLYRQHVDLLFAADA